MKACDSCGSTYEVTYGHSPIRDSDRAICEVCGHEMDSWNSTTWPEYTLKERRQPVEKLE